ncbi:MULTISPECIES: TraR/DksA C4-type zinc finger protein [Altibacter]|uniref:TraR/DksA family transcriptional regulator n=1 Tax=Altibacter TaxID=1535231 RepID=UPI0005572DD1|nr:MULTISPECIES: TraR/DksA C4-type zinc finger protein [Altibacter]MCW8982031.1 TraR/DksA C4-type zinc finger protein [Altibacter sp.]MCW9038711.1 TraR/DksA C4-type zinc finger protein [Altibacter sp.]
MKERKQIKKRIEEAMMETEHLVAKYRELSKPIAPENAIGRVSRMDAINNRSVNEAAYRKAEVKLKNLTVALSKIDDPDFGRCRKCKQPIPIERILLMPQVTTCVNCSK